MVELVLVDTILNKCKTTLGYLLKQVGGFLKIFIGKILSWKSQGPLPPRFWSLWLALRKSLWNHNLVPRKNYKFLWDFLRRQVWGALQILRNCFGGGGVKQKYYDWLQYIERGGVVQCTLCMSYIKTMGVGGWLVMNGVWRKPLWAIDCNFYCYMSLKIVLLNKTNHGLFCGGGGLSKYKKFTITD